MAAGNENGILEYPLLLYIFHNGHGWAPFHPLRFAAHTRLSVKADLHFL